MVSQQDSYRLAHRRHVLTGGPALPGLSEDPQDQGLISIVEAFTAAARRRQGEALRHARGTLAQAGALGISHEFLRWAWPLAARVAHELGDAAATRELLTMLDDCQPGHVAPMLRAERDLARARLAAHDGTKAPQPSRSRSPACASGAPPYHLAHGLLDHAEYLNRLGDTDAAEAAIGEARDIASRLRCQPLLDRAQALTPAKPPARA
jgi:hypothetical protein